jgi:hypothetical protein
MEDQMIGDRTVVIKNAFNVEEYPTTGSGDWRFKLNDPGWGSAVTYVEVVSPAGVGTKMTSGELLYEDPYLWVKPSGQDWDDTTGWEVVLYLREDMLQTLEINTITGNTMQSITDALDKLQRQIQATREIADRALQIHTAEDANTLEDVQIGNAKTNIPINREDGYLYFNSNKELEIRNPDIGNVIIELGSLDSRVTTNEANITTLDADLSTAEGNILDNAADILTNGGEISALDGRLTTAEADIDTLEANPGSILWDPSFTYSIGDVVVEGTTFYNALTSNTNQQPSSNPTDWQEIEMGGGSNGGGKDVGDIFHSMKDEATGAFKFRVGEPVLIAQYQALFDIVGHRFHDMQVGAGATSLAPLASATTFYPTPVPGYVPNMLPSFTSDSSNVASNQLDINEDLSTTAIQAILGSHQEKGIPVLVRVDSGAIPTGLTEWTRYFANFIDGSPDALEFYPTMADALAGTNIVGLTGAVGTVTIFPAYDENRMQQITGFIDNFRGLSGTNGGAFDDTTNGDATNWSGAGVADLSQVRFDSADSPNARTGDTTHGNEVYGNLFIQFQQVTSQELVLSPPPIAKKGWTAISDFTNVDLTLDYSGVSGLSGEKLEDLEVTFLVSPNNDGTEAYRVGQYTTTTVGFGFSIDTEVTDQIKVSLGDSGIVVFVAGVATALTNQSWFYNIIVTKKINTDLAIIQNVSGVNFQYPTFDISASNQTLDLTSLATEADGYRIKAKWTGGDGNYQLSIVLPTGFTYGGVAKATIETDWKGDGQGVIQVVKNGTDFEVEKFVDTDGGNWPVDATFTRKTWKKHIDGTIEQTATEEFTEATNTSSGSNFRITPPRAVQPYPLPIKAIDYSNIKVKEDTIGVSWISHWVDVAQNQLLNWGSYTPTRGSSTGNEDWEIVKIVKGRWTTTQVEVS